MKICDFVEGLRQPELSDTYLAACAGANMPIPHVRAVHETIRQVVGMCDEYRTIRERLKAARPQDVIDTDLAELESEIRKLQLRVDALRREKESREGMANRLRSVRQVVTMFSAAEFVGLATEPERNAAGLLLPNESVTTELPAETVATA